MTVGESVSCGFNTGNSSGVEFAYVYVSGIDDEYDIVFFWSLL